MKNPTVQKVVKVVTVAGSAILVLNAGLSLTKVKDVKSAVMPIVTILVGLAAFSYATGTSTVIVEKK